MTQKPHSYEAANDADRSPEASAAQPREPAAEPATGEAERDPFSVIEALNAENASLKDRMLRTLADMENLRRRTEKEVADSRTYGVTNFARDVLNAADNIHRALETVPAEDKAKADGAFKALIEGIELTERDLLKTLERHGVKRVDPIGERFDPHLHQAMFEVPDPTVPSGTVAQVVQAGFVIGDRVLRPALVGVSKGGPKAQAPASGGPGEPAVN